MTEPTIAERDAQIAELVRERDIASLDGAKAIKAALAAGKCATLADDLEALLPSLSPASVAAQQAGNVIRIMRNTRQLIDTDIARIEALVTAQGEG
jgi:hypothetical protein